MAVIIRAATNVFMQFVIFVVNNYWFVYDR